MTSLGTKNVGTIDRVVRIVAGLGITSLAFIGPQTPWAYLGLIFVVTAALGTCPMYSIGGVSTCAVGKK
jgi:hypothetical protein